MELWLVWLSWLGPFQLETSIEKEKPNSQNSQCLATWEDEEPLLL